MSKLCVSKVIEVDRSRLLEASMKIDNMSAINLAKNLIAHGRSKHIEMRFHYLQEQVEDGKMNLEHCRIENQIADIMTKGVQVKDGTSESSKGGRGNCQKGKVDKRKSV